MRTQGHERACPFLPKPVVLPDQWTSFLSKVRLSAFLAYLELPTGSLEAKAGLVEHLLRRLETDSTASAQCFSLMELSLFCALIDVRLYRFRHLPRGVAFEC